MAMSSSVQRLSRGPWALRSALSRPFSADSLVEIKPGEIGMVSGIPEEHLKRRVRSSIFCISTDYVLCVNSSVLLCFNFSYVGFCVLVYRSFVIFRFH